MKMSNLDAAYEITAHNNEAIDFNELWKKVCEYQEIPEEKRSSLVAKFYTQLSLDGRFITLGNNIWDLKVKYPFEKSKIDMNDVYYDADNEDEVSTNDNIDEDNLTEKDLFGDEEDKEPSEDSEDDSEEKAE